MSAKDAECVESTSSSSLNSKNSISNTKELSKSKVSSFSFDSFSRLDTFEIGASLARSEKKSGLLTAETLRVLSTIDVESLSASSQFELLFNDLSMLKASAVQGFLAATNFRCLAWMIFLGCLPMEKSEWAEAASANRTAYVQAKRALMCDPRLIEPSVDDHPLSQTTQSAWNKYFEESELKAVIVQDVMRINHPSAFLYKDSTKQQITDLLFVYVRSTGTEYRQGMHELLACVLNVLHDEYLALKEESNMILRCLADYTYLEHDAFTLFRAIMKRTHEWFGSTQPAPSPVDSAHRISLSLSPRLFQQHEEIYESLIMSKINLISDVILKNNDIEVSAHLNKGMHELLACVLNVLHDEYLALKEESNMILRCLADYTYLEHDALRWLRLLFLRELDFPSCLVLWDAIFATDNKRFSLVDYIFVALLCSLREELLQLDHSGCMRLLMQPHYELDALDVLKTALYLHNPAVCQQLKAIYARPVSMESSFEIVQINPKSTNSTTTPKLASSLAQNQWQAPNRTAVAKNVEMNQMSAQTKLKYQEANSYLQKINELTRENQSLLVKVGELEKLRAFCLTKVDALVGLLDEGDSHNFVVQHELVLLTLKQMIQALNEQT